MPTHGTGPPDYPAHSRYGIRFRGWRSRCDGALLRPPRVVPWTTSRGLIADVRTRTHMARTNSPIHRTIVRGLDVVTLPSRSPPPRLIYSAGYASPVAGSISRHAATVHPVYAIRCRRPLRCDSPSRASPALPRWIRPDDRATSAGQAIAAAARHGASRVSTSAISRVTMAAKSAQPPGGAPAASGAYKPKQQLALSAVHTSADSQVSRSRPPCAALYASTGPDDGQH